MRTEHTFLSADGKTGIHAVKRVPDSGECKAILQIVHGMVEYIERYEAFAAYMEQNGILVVGHDHLGHGESVTSRDQWGYFAPGHPSDILVEDIHALRLQTQQAYPDLPYFILGHSMGSYLLRKYIAIYGEGLSGVILSGTGYVSPSACAVAGKLCGLIAAFRGWEYRSIFISSLAFGKSYQRFDMTGSKPELSWLTKDVSIVERYYKDPKCTYTFTLNGYLGLFESVGFDCRRENVDKIPKNLPVLIVSGRDDPVGDLGVGVLKVNEMFKAAGLKDLTCRLYEHDRHEILNELDKDQVFLDILTWIQRRV